MDLVMAKNSIFLILAIFPVAFATEAVYEFYDLDVLKDLTDEGNKKILEISNVLNDIPEYYRDVTAERFECLQWECVTQKENVNISTADIVTKGLLKDKKLTNFQCISNSSRETFDKLNAKCSTLAEDSESVLKKGLNVVMQYQLLIPGFNKYVQDLYKTKKEELSKTNSEETKKKILLEVENKMKFLDTLLKQISAHIETLKHNFFEMYVDFAYAMETALRKIHKDGNQKMLKCIG